MASSVYTPPGYEADTEKRYPTLYLIHGYSDHERTWSNTGRAGVIMDNLIAEGTATPMVIVMPYGQAKRGGASSAQRDTGTQSIFLYTAGSTPSERHRFLLRSNL